MGSNQLYSLTWGEFGTSLVSAVQLLRCHGDLVDVTLAAGGRSFPAHKIVLCAASPFLLNLLKSTPCQHPVVLLAGVTASDLEALLEFVYRGEVSVDPNQLPSLLQAAHCLNIQGLAPGTISSEKPEELTAVSSAHEALTRDVINSFLPIRRRKRTKRRNSSGSGGKWARQDNIAADAENRPMEQQNVNPGSGSSGVPMTSEQDVLNIPDVPRKAEEVEANTQTGEESTSPLLLDPSLGAGGGKVRGASDQPGVCPLCGSMLRQARNLRRHLLTSCKYRMMGNTSPYFTALPAQPGSSSQPQMLPLEPLSSTSTPLILHSPGNETCEQIVCKVSPLPSPLQSPMPSPVSTSSNSTPSTYSTVATPPQLPPLPPPPLLPPSSSPPSMSDE